MQNKKSALQRMADFDCCSVSQELGIQAELESRLMSWGIKGENKESYPWEMHAWGLKNKQSSNSSSKTAKSLGKKAIDKLLIDKLLSEDIFYPESSFNIPEDASSIRHCMHCSWREYVKDSELPFFMFAMHSKPMGGVCPGSARMVGEVLLTCGVCKTQFIIQTNEKCLDEGQQYNMEPPAHNHPALNGVCPGSWQPVLPR